MASLSDFKVSFEFPKLFFFLHFGKTVGIINHKVMKIEINVGAEGKNILLNIKKRVGVLSKEKESKFLNGARFSFISFTQLDTWHKKNMA